MATFNKLNGFIEHVYTKQHDFLNDTFVIALSNTAPGSESTPPTGSTAACILANVTQIAYTNLSARTLTVTGAAQSGGTFKWTIADLVVTASGGASAAFRYAYIYNDTSTNDKLVCYFDYGSSITLNDGESITFDSSQVAGLFTDT